jgi:hypothetical protein
MKLFSHSIPSLVLRPKNKGIIACLDSCTSISIHAMPISSNLPFHSPIFQGLSGLSMLMNRKLHTKIPEKSKNYCFNTTTIFPNSTTSFLSNISNI